jgi:membrane protein
VRAVLSKFFADRGTHLAAMIAYFALLSFVPLLFLTLSLLGLTGSADESSYFVKELERALPKTSVSSIVEFVRTVQRHATALGVVGVLALAWTSISLFSVLESAFNIVYGRPNRPFLQGKARAFAFLAGVLVTTFAGLLVASLGYGQLRRHAPGLIANKVVAFGLPVLFSALALFAFLVCSYYLLTNEPLRLDEVLPGAGLATVLMEATFQVLPIYLHESKRVPFAQAFGGPAILLLWLYLMANLIVLGAEVNWWAARREPGRSEPAEEAAGLA